jgi:Putative Flp pilus-assembly TadE/G-like
MRRTLRTARGHRSRGAVALLVAFSLPVLLGLAALVIDLGRLYVIKSELQNAMDACALAAATPLTGASDATLFDIARAQGLALSDGTVSGNGSRPPESVNRVHFQQEAVNPAQIEVSFASAAAGPWRASTGTNPQGLAPADARLVRCHITDGPRGLWVLPVLQALGLPAPLTASVSAQAVAALAPGQRVCAMPIAPCAVPGSSAANNFGLVVGQRLTAVNNPGAGYGGGHFGWLDFTPPNGGASELAGLIEGGGMCAVAIGTPVGQPGQVNSLERSWNTRFGLYAGGTAPTAAAPDYTGWGYASGGGNHSDYQQRRIARTPFQGQVKSGTTVLLAAQHQQLGTSRRLATAPIVACDDWNGGKGSAQVQVLDLACVLMLAPVRSGGSPTGAGVGATMDIEFLGLAGRPGVPCATLGEVGSGSGRLVPGLIQ